jgi:hypothetical protein
MKTHYICLLTLPDFFMSPFVITFCVNFYLLYFWFKINCLSLIYLFLLFSCWRNLLRLYTIVPFFILSTFIQTVIHLTWIWEEPNSNLDPQAQICNRFFILFFFSSMPVPVEYLEKSYNFTSLFSSWLNHLSSHSVVNTQDRIKTYNPTTPSGL